MFLIAQNESLTIVVLVCLPVLLLDSRLGNLEAPVHCTQPCKSWLGKIRPVVVVTDLVLDSLGHLAELLAHDRLVVEAGRLVLLLCFGCREDHRSLLATGWLHCHGLLVGKARVLVGVNIVEIVGLLAELNLRIAIAKLFDQEGVILPHDLPDQGIRNCCHLCLP